MTKPSRNRIAEAVESHAAHLSEHWQAAIAMAVEIATAEQPEAGLTQQQDAIVRYLRKRSGRTVSTHDMERARIVKKAGQASVVLCHLLTARPDLRRHIQTTHGEGYRWTP